MMTIGMFAACKFPNIRNLTVETQIARILVLDGNQLKYDTNVSRAIKVSNCHKPTGSQPPFSSVLCQASKKTLSLTGRCSP